MYMMENKLPHCSFEMFLAYKITNCSLCHSIESYSTVVSEEDKEKQNRKPKKKKRNYLSISDI